MTLATASKPALIDASARIDPSALIGGDCVIKSGAYVGAGVNLGAGVVVGANAVFVDAESDTPGTGTQVKRLARIGANASIYAGVVIAERAEVRPGAVVTRSVPPNAIVEGNPANIVGYVDAAREAHPFAPHATSGARQGVEATAVDGVTVHHFPIIPDLRGNLTVGEFDKQVPFLPKRYFMVFGVPSREIRGEHAHRRCHQFLICLRGSCAVVADDGKRKVEIELDAPNRGLYLPPMTWGIQYKHTPDALLLVFASDYYDGADYIRDYDEFIAELGSKA